MVQKKLVQKMLASCVAFVIGITALITIIMNVNKSTATGGVAENPSGNVPKISAGYEHTLAIQDGKLFAWGKNEYGQLGDGTTVRKTSPVRIGNEANWVSISAGAYHSLAINDLGELWAWGRNQYGQLGDGKGGDGIEEDNNKSSPVRIGSENNWVSISAGNNHSLAINALGEIWAWGGNYYGQLGDGTGDATNDNNKNAPVRIGNETNWVSISAGGSAYSLAINSLGELYAWGHNYFGQLGDGTGDGTNDYNKNTPVKIGNKTNWTTISAGWGHSLALNSVGELYVWGYNMYGQIGNVSKVNRNAPVKIGSETNWVSVAAGYYHSMAINSLGELWTWGWNVDGQLGDGTKVDRTAPVKIGNQTNWSNIYGGGYFSLATNSFGELLAWGYNGSGQLGLGDYVSRQLPTEVIIGSNVAAPNSGTGYTVSSPSASRVTFGGSYTFTIIIQTDFSMSAVRLDNGKGLPVLSGTEGNKYTFTISNVVDDIVATDFTVTVTRIT